YLSKTFTYHINLILSVKVYIVFELFERWFDQFKWVRSHRHNLDFLTFRKTRAATKWLKIHNFGLLADSF
ncbi:MAG TPA: hypothetical protein V6D31_08300, partial [Candidatus Sericytochromatia bacterium]